MTTRDFDVVIKPESGGVRVDWTSVIRRGGDPLNPGVRRKKISKSLRSTNTPNVFHGWKSGNPLEGKELCWAQSLVPAGVEAFGNELDILNIPLFVNREQMLQRPVEASPRQRKFSH
jgi:hypothetical protein